MKLLVPCAALALALVAGCASTPPEDDPVQIKLNDLDARTQRIERVISNNSLLDLAQRMDALQAQMRALQGRIDELQNANDALRKQQRDLYADLDRRLTQLSASGAGAAAGGSGGGAANPGAAAEQGDQAAYEQALNTLKAGKYADAIAMLRQFVTSYPRSNLADNAEYWLGEAYYVQRDFPDAATAFRMVGDQWPGSRKAADAQLKLGYCQIELKQYAAARATLTDVAKRFPDTSAAKLAAQRLQGLSGDAAGGTGGAAASSAPPPSDSQ
ncbi:MAG TPA: tol-pal system protein YbgF [Steroidobacteraceae bacterium]|nr:tol-pal system protein YbgF [Steroidobacteraceae bacterium]